jgi:5-oxoprolinase (ATP-hydrolysing) subunit A
LLTSVSVACGGHAGTPDLMRRTVVAAVLHGCSVGAHPGFRDVAGFGRRNIAANSQAIERLVIEQVDALAEVAGAAGANLRHVKPHGALYHRASADRATAEAVVRAIRAIDADLIVVGLAGSSLIAAARRAGVAAAEEAFIDRAYQADGTLVPRDRPNALIVDPETVVARLHGLVRDRVLTATDGTTFSVAPQTLCVHLDTPNVERLAATLRAEMTLLNVAVAPMVGRAA